MAAYQLIVLYHHPENAEAFDKHYDEIHAPLAARLPGLRSYTAMRPVAAGGERPAYHLAAVLTFDDENAFIAAMAGEEGRAAVADLANFAGAGTTMLTGPAGVVV
ncbi:EthD family reductase [Nonomuraea aridisoli]|uniref:EthD family reductase n=1 Tax=Nonomuraea aridisoli TaxID=2070368 RepID=A0A2W2E378_9ACTN|nr:EthD family reductase [Nonomuraea aridisoli]PZG18442.1 EthD family reductase [Nonomuraea aridisoli]